MSNIRTDLALEAHEGYLSDGQDLEGVKVDTNEYEHGIVVSVVDIVSEKGEELLKKSKGKYVTIEAKALTENNTAAEEKTAQILAQEIKTLAGQEALSGGVLVVGLGNSYVTPDALGPEVVKHLFVSRHIKKYAPDEIDERVNEVSALSPGVLGNTGLETGEVIKGVIENIKPSLIVAVDSLASRKIERLRTTVQLTDSGISPGSGIGNKRMALNKEELGVPVIAIGVPLVVYAVTIATDLLNETLMRKNSGNPISEEDNMLYNNIINEMMDTKGAELVVTPKEIDIIVRDCAKIIANALNSALHNDINIAEVKRYLN